MTNFTCNGSKNSLGFSETDQVEYQNLDNELVDSEDDVADRVFPDNAISRRKLRMVIDLEDDD